MYDILAVCLYNVGYVFFLIQIKSAYLHIKVICFKLFNRIEQCENNILIGSNLTSGYRSGQRITKPGEFAYIYLFIHI